MILWITFSSSYIFYSQNPDTRGYLNKVELFVAVGFQAIGSIVFILVGSKLLGNAMNQSKAFFNNPLVKMHKALAILAATTIVFLALKTILQAMMIFKIPDDWGLSGYYIVTVAQIIEPIILLSFLGAIPEEGFQEAAYLKLSVKSSDN